MAKESILIIGSGGRILGVTAYSQNGSAAACKKAYKAADLIRYESKILRTDIAHNALR